MVLYIFNEYKKIFFLNKEENYNRFLSLFHGRLVAAVFNRREDPPRNSWQNKKPNQRIKLSYIFLLGELNNEKWKKCEIKNFDGFKECVLFLNKL